MFQDFIKPRLSLSLRPYWLLLKITIIAYLMIYLFSFIMMEWIIDSSAVSSDPIVGRDAYLFTLLFLLVSAPIIYLFNSFLAKKFLRLELDRLLLYAGLTMMLGSILDLVVDYCFVMLIDRPSYLYRIWPKHNGFTSGVTCIMWPLYGFHLYLFHKAMHYIKSPLNSSAPVRGIMMGIDAMIMETIANTLALLSFNSYYFYYLKGDLRHFTTIEIFIPYLVIGIALMYLLQCIDRKEIPRFWIGIVLLFLGWFILSTSFLYQFCFRLTVIY